MLKRFPLKARLSVTFGLLFAVSMTIINVISIRSSRLTLERQAASHLITLAENQATIFEQTYIEKFRTQMETLARGSVVSNPNMPLSAKIAFLKNETEIAKKDGSLVCTIAAPIYGQDKTIIGTIATVYDGLKIYETIRNIKIGETGEVYILDKDGVTIAN